MPKADKMKARFSRARRRYTTPVDIDGLANTNAPYRLRNVDTSFLGVEVEPKAFTKEQLEDQFRVDLYHYQYLIYQRMVGYGNTNTSTTWRSTST